MSKRCTAPVRRDSPISKYNDILTIMISVAIQGAGGKLGSKIAEHLERSDNFKYVGPITRESDVPDCDVVVDVSGAEGTKALISKLNGQKLLIGSTGDLPVDMLESYAHQAAVLTAPNFSIGMRILYKLLQNIEPSKCSGFEKVIDDVHHIHKIDSPSGTALKMQTILKENNIDVCIKSERSAEVLGDHSLVLQNKNERIRLSHEVLNRDVYAEGCLELISELVTLDKGLHIR